MIGEVALRSFAKECEQALFQQVQMPLEWILAFTKALSGPFVGISEAAVRDGYDYIVGRGAFRGRRDHPIGGSCEGRSDEAFGVIPLVNPLEPRRREVDRRQDWHGGITGKVGSFCVASRGHDLAADS